MLLQFSEGDAEEQIYNSGLRLGPEDPIHDNHREERSMDDGKIGMTGWETRNESSVLLNIYRTE